MRHSIKNYLSDKKENTTPYIFSLKDKYYMRVCHGLMTHPHEITL